MEPEALDAEQRVTVRPRPSVEPTTRGASESEQEDARAGYGSVVDLWIYEGDSTWARFNAMLVANSILLTLAGVTYDSDSLNGVFKAGLAGAGLVFCLVWTVLTKRSFDYYRYWILTARELEERYLHPAVRTVSRGNVFAEGRPAEFFVGGQRMTHRMSWLGRTVRIAWCAYIIIAAFAVLYSILLAGLGRA
jgi:hypothetical protein